MTGAVTRQARAKRCFHPVAAGTRATQRRAAGAKGRSESATDTNDWDGLDEPWYNDERAYKDVTLGDGRYSVSYEMEAQEGRRETRYGVTGEESKINVNRASQADIKVFLETAGGADAIAATELAAAICDWRDPDDDPLTGGAESSYYQSLNPPYRCHDGEFESLRELLLVKGMGGDLFRRIERYMTVYGSGKVNVNTADAMILTSVARASGGQAAVCESLVAKLLAFRGGGGVFREPSSSVMTRQLSGAANLQPEEEALFSAMMGTMATRSTCFGGVACGKARGRETEQSRIDFVFDRERTTILDWHEH